MWAWIVNGKFHTRTNRESGAAYKCYCNCLWMWLSKKRIGSNIIRRRFRNPHFLKISQENGVVIFYLEIPLHFVDGIIIKSMVIQFLDFLVVVICVKSLIAWRSRFRCHVNITQWSHIKIRQFFGIWNSSTPRAHGCLIGAVNSYIIFCCLSIRAIATTSNGSLARLAFSRLQAPALTTFGRVTFCFFSAYQKNWRPLISWSMITRSALGLIAARIEGMHQVVSTLLVL